MSSICQSRSLSLPISCDETEDLSAAYPARCSSQNDAIISASTEYEYSTKSLMVPPSIFLHVSASIGKGKSLYCCVATKGEHDGPIVALALVGNRLYCASGGGINVRNHPEFSECNSFGSGVGPVKSLLVNGKEIFSAHQNNKIQVWHCSSKGKAHHKRVATIPTVVDYLASYVSDKKFVEVRRHYRRPWMEHADTISTLSLSKDGFLYSGSWDRSVKVWKLPNFKCIESFKAHDDAINTIVVAKRERVLYTGSADGTIKVWRRRPEMGKHVLITILKKSASAVNALVLSSDDCLLYSGGSDGTIQVWKRKELPEFMSYEKTLLGHRLAVLCVALEREILFSGSADKSIRVWKMGPGGGHSCIAVLEGHKGPVKCLAASATNMAEKGFLISSGSFDRSVKLWFVSIHEQEDASLDKD